MAKDRLRPATNDSNEVGTLFTGTLRADAIGRRGTPCGDLRKTTVGVRWRSLRQADVADSGEAHVDQVAGRAGSTVPSGKCVSGTTPEGATRLATGLCWSIGRTSLVFSVRHRSTECPIRVLCQLAQLARYARPPWFACLGQSKGFPRLRTPITHGVTSPAPASPAGSFCRRQPSGNRRHVLSEPVPTTRRSPPHDGRTKVVVS
jgi:hypothetical protein